MKKLGYIVMAVSMLWLAACAPTPVEPTEAPDEPTEEPAAETKTMVIGFTASQTGKYNVSSTRQVNGLHLWMEQVNGAGQAQLA